MLGKALLLLVCCAALSYGVPQLTNRISGGIPAFKGEFPWHVSIQRAIAGYNWTHLCDGAIVSTEFVITNGWCSSFDIGSYQVAAGSVDWANPGSTHNVVEFIDDPLRYGYLTLWRVDPPFEFTVYLSPVRLPAAFVESCPGTEMTVSGWGESEPYQPSNQLVKLNSLIVSKALCYPLAPGIRSLVYHICAKSSSDESGFCNHAGGFGAPLVYNGELRGVFHYQTGCEFPVVYTEVSLFREWISDVTGV
ncbi:Hypothetical predicted protein [Cloeon dipterum]|uniref:Peptidase S1 domain-containing protein n=1 Tax=Cloeon dipterum TaxID=197152 RepID=A0A8S1DJE2_9INSE|nr:Hypothetical predicted protein [Cloeon dipterum]